MDVFAVSAQVDEEVLGQQVTKDLVPGGAEIPVTEENKAEYIKQVIQWRFVARVRLQMDRLMEGFHDVIPLGYINTFDEGELELLLGGIGSIDVADWREHTEYKGSCKNKILTAMSRANVSPSTVKVLILFHFEHNIFASTI